jgi:hypothetical protein
MYRHDYVAEYEDGKTVVWSWTVPTDSLDGEGFVARKDLLPVINYKSGSVLFGFNGGTGVMELTESQGQELLRLFKAGRKPLS